jgi:hypothetical protein
MAGAGQPTEWYLARDNKPYGPLGEAEMAKLVELRHLKEHDLVWRAGFSEWMPAGTVFPQAFAASEPVHPPPAPSPAPAPTAGMASAPAPQLAFDPRSHAPAAADAHQPVAAKVETLAEYRARIGARQEPAPQPQPIEQPRAEAFAVASTARAAPHGGSRRMWIGPADDAAGGAPRPDMQAPRAPGPAPRDDAPRPAGNAAAAGFARPHAAPGAPAGYGPAAAPGPRREPAFHQPMVPTRAGPTPEEDDLGEDPPRRRRRGRGLLGLLVIMVLLAVIGGGTWLAIMQPQSVRQIMRSLGIGDVRQAPVKSGAATTPASEKRAAPSDLAAAKAPAPKVPAAAMQGFPENAAAIDKMLQAGKLWQLIKAEFPDWYEERVREVQRMVAEKKPDESISKHVIDALIALRRKNAEHAFQASLPRLQLIARTFRDNLDSLTQHSQVACYSLISSGEGSRGMIGLFRDPAYSQALQGGILAVFEAIAEGRRAPTTVLPARRGDYDLLTRELTAMGWSEGDLNLFADSQQLARSSPEQVCRMVREWFTAHLAVPDKGVQTRLLMESVKPVVAG